MKGYDNVSGRYRATWNDSMSTGLMMSEGTCDTQGRTCTFIGSRILIGIVLAGCVAAAGGGSSLADETAQAAPDGTASVPPAGAKAGGSGVAGPTERVQVTATRLPESTDALPGFLTVVSGDDLLRRGVRDLPSALAMLAGVSVAPGGDGGPAGAVPEFLGLRELDAFLITVDGVPWGGAFVPALATLDLENVDRVEVLRGPAPVAYGATSFVGVINVIRRSPGRDGLSALGSGGSYGSGRLHLISALPEPGRLQSSLDATTSTQGYRDPRAGVDRGLLRWRGQRPAGRARLSFSAEAIRQEQDPASPRLREGTALSPLVPPDANHNPLGSHLDETRFVLGGTLEQPAGAGRWLTTVSATRSRQDVLRGFLTDASAPSDNAHGFRQRITLTEIYLDSHLELAPRRRLRLVAGLDHQHGAGRAASGDFDYTVGPDGSRPPDGGSLPNTGEADLSDHREFSGLYGQAFWEPAERWHLEAGLRLNRTSESRRTRQVELSTSATSAGRDERADLRGGGMAGATFTAWRQDENAIRLFADYRNTFKPAVIDFGPEAEPTILAPETGAGVEAGLKGRLGGGRLEFVLAGFRMNLRNIVVSQSVGGLPALVNAGAERLRGLDLESHVRLRRDLDWRIGYSLHDARFRDFVTEFGGVPAPIEGNRLEMSARHLASTGLDYGRPLGWQWYAQGSYVGSRYLDKRNTALAPAYVTWDAGLAYRFREFEIRVDGRNLNDQRPPVAESELGDAQYYLLPERRIEASLCWRPVPGPSAAGRGVEKESRRGRLD